MSVVQLAGADPVQVLGEIAARGLSITVSGADLRLQGPRERMDPELIGRIKACKAELVAHLAAASGPQAGPPAAAAEAAEAGSFPLTPLQRSYLLGRGEVFEMGNVANHVYWEVEGRWDLDRLEAALRSVVRRHGMLRTRFTADGRQVEQAWPVPVGIARLDLRGETGEEQHRRRLELREQRSHRVLPADRAPLIAVDVTILADDRMVLHVSLDGLVADGISTFLFFRHLWASYQASDQAGSAAEGADEPQEASFAAYVAALEAARTRAPAQRSQEYWFSRLDDLAPHPDLPLRTSPSAITQPRFTQRLVRLDAPAWTALKDRAAQAGLTPSGLLLAAYAQTLAAWGAGERFTLTTTVANRPPIHPRIFDAIGSFSDTMLVEVELARGASFRERARALQERLRHDLDNRHFSGIELMRELGRRRGGAAQARMPYTFNSAVGYVYGDVDGSTLELFGPEVYAVSQTPQVWLNVFAMEQHGGLVVKVDSVDALFPEGLPGALVEGYQTLLERLLDEAAWAQSAFDLLPPAQRARRQAANDTAAPLPDGLLQDAFIAQATRAPDAPAVLTTRATLSYGELLARARHAAAWLRARRVGRDELVALVMTRGPEQVVGILATLLAGAAYLPIDANLPAWRQRYLLRDGKVRCALTNCGWTAGSPQHGGDGAGGTDEVDVLELDVAEPLVVAEPLDVAEPLVVAGPPDVAGPLAGAAVPDVPPAAGANPDDLAYVLYTSGTTGEPKGVMVSHRSVANVVADCNARFAVTPRDRLFGISAFTFDLSAYDIFGALTAGAAVVLPDHDKAADSAHWLALCERFGVTVWSSVPAIVSLLHDQAVADGPAALATLRLVMMSGDRIPPDLPAALRRLKADLALVSLGGPTETTIWNILHPITAADDGSRSIPYGRPNANNRAYVLDPDGLDAPDWVAGEICAAGTGLARGYWGDEARTAERFCYDPRRGGERLYRTGDIGRYLPDGSIEILGRSDHQVKVNGYRIEAGEVETRLVAVGAVGQAVVVRQEGARGDRLVAHLVAAGEERPPDAALRSELRTHLPEYMVPSVFVWHEQLPLTRNGKVDRARLAAGPPGETPAAGVPAAGVPGAAVPAAAGRASSELEQALAQLWASVLKVAQVAPDDDFNQLGGDSIAAARIITGVRKQFGVTIPMHRLPEVATVRAMAAYLASGA